MRTALVLLLLPAQAWAQSTVTKAEFRSQPQRTTERQLKDQLWAIFEPVDERRGKDRPSPRVPLRSSWLVSHSYATPVPGLCRIDGVTLQFAPVRDSPHNAQTPVRAYGLEARSYFYFRKPPKGQEADIADSDRSPWDPECAGLDLYKQEFFSASNATTATDGYYAMLLAKRVSEGGKLQPDCQRLAAFEKRPCVQIVADFARGGISNVAECEGTYPLSCYRIIDGADMQMEVTVDEKEALRSVALDQLIIIRDTLID